MIDRENVITHLQIIRTWSAFAREHDLQFFTAKHLEDIVQWADDALELLKEQEDMTDAFNEVVARCRKYMEKCGAIPTYKGKRLFFADGKGNITPLPEIVRCKDCKYRGDRHKCIVAFVAEKQEMPYFFYDNRGEWFCADGVRKDE